MVVQYRDVPVRFGSDQGFHAVLLAGDAHGDTQEDRALEEFLRAAEPPAHEEWIHTTDRIRAEYGYGFKKALDDLFGAIDKAVRELTREEANESDEGPDALKKLFPMPGTGPTVQVQTYRLEEPQAHLEGDQWIFSGSYLRRPSDEQERDRPWGFTVQLSVDQEGSGSPTRIPIDFHANDPSKTSRVSSDGSVTVNVPSGTNRVAFSGASKTVDQLPPGGLRRARLRLDLKTLSAKGGPSESH
jgi:RNA polymerase primary sigma factor